ncbi:MAG: hypothetical protein WD334_11575 [Chitinophagales bacterium]
MFTKQMPYFLALVFLFTACQNSGESESNEKQTAKEEKTEKKAPESKISLEPLKPKSPVYGDATLELANHKVNSGGEVEFDFKVSNYTLGEQTSDAEGKGLANSPKGQHIHFIDNNGPYSAHYESTFSKELEEGNHVILAFLSRSYHESVKSGKAALITQLQIGEGAELLDLDQPIMFYSRPKGTYKGKDTENVLLDFYLHNVDLSLDGYKVRALVNGEEFLLTKWAPFVIKGAPKGELNIKLELLDANDELVDAPFNPVERTVTLEE